jgi:hypothetical protein
MTPHQFRPGLLSAADADALTRLSRMTRGNDGLMVRPPLSLVRQGSDGQAVLYLNGNSSSSPLVYVNAFSTVGFSVTSASGTFVDFPSLSVTIPEDGIYLVGISSYVELNDSTQPGAFMSVQLMRDASIEARWVVAVTSVANRFVAAAVNMTPIATAVPAGAVLKVQVARTFTGTITTSHFSMGSPSPQNHQLWAIKLAD